MDKQHTESFNQLKEAFSTRSRTYFKSDWLIYYDANGVGLSTIRSKCSNKVNKKIIDSIIRKRKEIFQDRNEAAVG